MRSVFGQIFVFPPEKTLASVVLRMVITVIEVWYNNWDNRKTTWTKEKGLVAVNYKRRLNQNCLKTYLGTGDFGLLDHDEGRGDESTLSHIIYWVIGHWLQQIDGFLWRYNRHYRRVGNVA